MDRSLSYIHLYPKKREFDVVGPKIEGSIAKHLKLKAGVVHNSKLFVVGYPLTQDELSGFAEKCLTDPVVDSFSLDSLAVPEGCSTFLLIAKKPGVTDDEGTSAQKSLADLYEKELDVRTQHIFSQELIFFTEKLTDDQLEKIGTKLLGNPLINHFQYGSVENFSVYAPSVQITTDERVEEIDLDISDDELIRLSQEQVLSLDLAEMKAVQGYYKDSKRLSERKAAGLGEKPTDCELEILAQTWSEHCKHKEFAAEIVYNDKDKGTSKTIDSLFKTYIKGSTDKVKEALEKKNNKWLIKVFSDNAGVVDLDEKNTFVWKVETHNSPSAIDPYGGAITGILGNNRDPLGTGIGGGRLLFNTNVLCFGDPEYNGELIGTQLHPRRIFEGVVKGIEDGGNKSGIPTVNGSIIFDERYAGKPLVYCGTGGIIPKQYNGKNAWEKNIDAGDLIIMAGGRVGKDGIHGATFSSVEINEFSPSSAVQIGSPITQKLVADFLERATVRGLIKCSTDNGAGGLSSSVGELATISGGAKVELADVPLKYSGLRPWEIFISESQERMTLVVEPGLKDELFALALEMDVELSHVGEFTSDGMLSVSYNKKLIAMLDIDFLHDGVPRKKIEAEWLAPELHEPKLAHKSDYTADLVELLGSLNIASKEWVIRQYDHEVKGKSVIKPLMGDGNSPQDAAVIRTGFDNFEGIAVSNGIIPRYGDIDAYQMSAGSFDEALRQIISVGGELPNMAENDGIFWTVNDNFCVPDSVYDPEKNPDGKQKMAKLVQMCEALYDMATFYNVPMTSGKDSMKNDFKAGKKKISVPPTILYSMAAKIKDVRKTVTSNFKAAGDLVYVLGKTYDELGGSEYYNMKGELGKNVPLVRKEESRGLYLKVIEANKKGLIQSSHDLSDGGFAVALAESCFGTQLGAQVNISAMHESAHVGLFSETHSRFVVSVKSDDQTDFEALMGGHAVLAGRVTADSSLSISHGDHEIVKSDIDKLLASWKGTFGIME